MRRLSDIRDIDIGFDPVDIEGSSNLKAVYQSLRGFAPQRERSDRLALQSGIMGKKNSSDIRNICARVDLEFDEEITLDALRDALEPGMAGGKLDDAVLTESPVPTQAEWFHKAEPLFERARSRSGMSSTVHSRRCDHCTQMLRLPTRWRTPSMGHAYLPRRVSLSSRQRLRTSVPPRLVSSTTFSRELHPRGFDLGALFSGRTSVTGSRHNRRNRYRHRDDFRSAF